MQFSESKNDRSFRSVQSSDTNSHQTENISSLINNNKEILINKGHILDIQNLICEMKEGLSKLNKKMEFIEEFFTNNFKRKAIDPDYLYNEKSSKQNSKIGKTAIKSDQLSSKSKNQKSILNLGFIKTIKLSESTLKANRKDSDADSLKEKLNLNNKLNEIDMSEAIDELDDDNTVIGDSKEQTIILPLQISEASSVRNFEREIQSENEEIQPEKLSENVLNKKEINQGHAKIIKIQKIHAQEISNKGSNKFTQLNTEEINKPKQKMELDDKTMNYNQKFFDYKELHKEKEKETLNLKTKHESADYISYNKRLKNDWIKKESEGVKKSESSPLKEFKWEYASKSDSKQYEPMNYMASTNLRNQLYKEDADLKKLIEKTSESTPSKTSLQKLAIESKFNSERKIESSQLSLAFDSNVHSKEKFNNNFIANQPEKEKKSTRFSDFLKLKEEKSINISKLKDQIQARDQKKNSYELDLCTLEDTFDEFYDLKPKNFANKTKINPLKLNDYKSNSNSNINTKTNAFITNKNGIIRNKKEREKLNGHKCEICESFYEILGETCQTCSRHRTDEDPNRTPKGYYEMTI